MPSSGLSKGVHDVKGLVPERVGLMKDIQYFDSQLITGMTMV